MEFYFSLRVYLRYHFLVIYENVNCYNVLRGIGVGEQLPGLDPVGKQAASGTGQAGNRRGPVPEPCRPAADLPVMCGSGPDQ